MKTTIDHLPEDKQAKLRAITSIFTEPREGAPVGMLILFGSHARGDWVEDAETGYKSDYDFLVVVDTEEQAADVMLWAQLEQRVRAIIGETPLTLIVHDVKFVNREIRIGQYFFSDIANEGVMLYDSRRFTLAKPKALNAEERLALAERNFASWFDSAGKFWRGSRDYGARLWLKEAAFLLHQATERYYHSAILVHTGYKQRTHDIELLGNLAGEQHALMAGVLPKTEPEEKHLFDLLKRAYIDARYSMSYRISSAELATLQAQVLVLAARVREACLEKIATFCGADAMRKDLPTVPQMGEAVLANLSPPPTDPQEFGQWAQNLAELAEQRVQAERVQGEVRGRAEGLVQGKTEGRAEGFQAGEAHGRALGEANALLLVLRSRGVEVSAELEQRIMACTDPALLAAWLQRVANVASAAELLAG
jgi:predicted nucleotidyltransferase/HEPN domain-containing protein